MGKQNGASGNISGSRRSLELPALFPPDRDAAKRFVEFFNIRNPNTQRPYARAAVEFAAWCEQNELWELHDIEPVHAAAYIETLQTTSRGAFGEATSGCDPHVVRLAGDWTAARG